MPRPAEWAEDEVAKLRTEVQQLFETNGDLANAIGRLENENFALAANQCHDGYAGEYGHHMCREVEQLKAEIEYWKGFVPTSILRDFPFKKVQDGKT
jgi:hypothetical protein